MTQIISIRMLQLITARKDHLYHQLTGDDSFLKTFFKTLKEGRKTGAIANVFITGVLPVTMDELASAYNIAHFITLSDRFEAMLGFAQTEVDQLVDDIYADYEFDRSSQKEVHTLLRSHYNGYHFVNANGEAIYNPTLVTQFFDKGFFPISFYYLGMLTIQDRFYLKLPNLKCGRYLSNILTNCTISTSPPGLPKSWSRL